MATQADGSVVFRSVEQRFPPRTVVNVYSRGVRQPSAAFMPATAPGGNSLGSATVGTDGSLALSGLPSYQWLVAYAKVNGEHRYMAFSTWPTSR